ncbi:hypothetical protein M422DRAFT_31500 [Sphaerobolus stellatus SS14]|uniref:Uncharacterized protein n=1 Tax=Sphaerobolus stellatus (strain SS14) TaxID=990650 RepID=A0A0C9VU93_SPHS4|nr:hypothetical protein M422DRAFT_31500 [Sphaerobolus stellatus SS14]
MFSFVFSRIVDIISLRSALYESLRAHTPASPCVLPPGSDHLSLTIEWLSWPPLQGQCVHRVFKVLESVPLRLPIGWVEGGGA